MARKLKVFRTAAGFYDAYVAAPNRKAALEAWGSDKDLFARGVAEEVTEAALTKAPLEQPGKVIKLSRGSAADQMAALPPDKPARAKRRKVEIETPSSQSSKPKPKPKPDRSRLDALEAKVAYAEKSLQQKAKSVAKEEAALARARRALDQERSALDDLKSDAEIVRSTYERAMDRWRSE